MSESSDVELLTDSHRIKRVRYREPAVVVTIMSLFFLCGITTAVEDVMLKTIRVPGVLSLWKLCQTIIPLPGLYLTMFLSDYTGRRPVIAMLFLLCILSTILHSVSLAHTHTLLLAFVVQCLLKSGTMIMTIIGIWEYSSPKNKLTYMIANAGVWQMTDYIPKTEFYRVLLGIDSLYMKVIAVLLGVVCLGWTLQWPETPFWLGSKDKTEESRTAFLWMHGEEELQTIEERVEASQASQDSNEPSKLYSFSLFVLMVTIIIYKTTVWYQSYKAVDGSTDFISNEFKTGLLICTSIFVVCSTVVIMKNIKQTLAYSTILGITAVFCILAYLAEPLVKALRIAGKHPMLVYALKRIYDFMNNCGPLILVLGFLVKTVPQEYKKYALTLLSYVQLGLAAMMLIYAIIVSYD